jgi:hypothetical protein
MTLAGTAKGTCSRIRSAQSLGDRHPARRDDHVRTRANKPEAYVDAGAADSLVADSSAFKLDPLGTPARGGQAVVRSEWRCRD